MPPRHRLAPSASSTAASVAALALLVAAAARQEVPAAAQLGQNAPQPVRWTMEVDPKETAVKPGGTLTAVVTATIDEGWHVYAPDPENPGPRPVSLTIAAGGLFQANGEMEAPEPERAMDEALGQVTSSYAGQAVFRLPVKVASSAAAGRHPLRIEVVFQACDGRMCLPPRTVALEQAVTVGS